MDFQRNYSLKAHNTFGIDVKAKYYSTFSNVEDLDNCIKNKPTNEILVLGGGSNILFTKDIDATVLVNAIKGKKVIHEDDNQVIVSVGAGEIWHEFVLFCIEKNWCGVENLSLIPGSVGASPMQNIGAYGVEIKDVFHELEAYEIKTGKIRTFSHVECQFGYRESVFKKALKGQYIITSVIYKLSKTPNLSTHYGAIQSKLDEMEVKTPSIRDVSNAVIAIRESKLPNPKLIGNAGSFFKNPVIQKEIAETLKLQYPNMPIYEVDSEHSKLAAGWLIEQTGWKGKTFDNYGVHKHQALVLVNYGGANGHQIELLSEDIMLSVKKQFNIQLEREVNIV